MVHQTGGLRRLHLGSGLCDGAKSPHRQGVTKLNAKNFRPKRNRMTTPNIFKPMARMRFTTESSVSPAAAKHCWIPQMMWKTTWDITLANSSAKPLKKREYLCHIMLPVPTLNFRAETPDWT